MDNRAHRPGGMGSSAQGVVGASCRACGDVEPGTPAWGDGESCPGGGRSFLQGLRGRRTGHTGLGGWGVLSRGWSEFPAGPAGMDNRAHQPGGMGSPAQGVVGVSCRACGDVEPGTPAWGDGEPSPGGGRSFLQGLQGWTNGAHRPGGMGSPAQGVVGASCRANWGPSSSENRAHRPRGDGESCPGGVRSLLPGQRGAIFFREPGAPAWGGRGALPRGCSEPPARPMGGHPLQRTGRTGPGGTGSPAQGVFGVSCQANGGPSSSENRAHRPGGDGESCPGGVRSLLPGQWGAIFCREPGAPAWGGRGAQPRGCSESPVRPMGGHLLQRTGRTGLGGTGSPAQGVFGVSCKADGGPSASENRAHRPGGDGEPSPGGVRSLLVVRGVMGGVVWVGGGGRRCRAWGPVIGSLVAVAGKGNRGGVCRRGHRRQLAGAGCRVLRPWPGLGGGAGGGWCGGGAVGGGGGGGGCCAGWGFGRPCGSCGCCVCAPCGPCGS